MTEEIPHRTIEIHPQRPRLWSPLLSALSSSYQPPQSPPGFLTLTGDAVVWKETHPDRSLEIPYTDIRSVRENRGLIVLGRAGKSLLLPESWFPEPGLAGSIVEDLRARIERLPEGEAILARIEEHRKEVESLASRGRAVTISIAAVLGAIFLLQISLGATEDLFRLLAFGANSGFFVREGEWFRLATGNLLHAGPVHLILNLLALLTLGGVLEPLLGKPRLLVIFLGSALAGAAGSALVGNHLLAVGASTGIAGLIGALGVAERRWPEFFGRRPSWNTWLSLGFWIFLPGSLYPNIDNYAHVAGFLAGLLLGFICTDRGDPLSLERRQRPLWSLLAALLVGLFVVACALVVRRWGDPERDLATAARLLEVPEASPELVNEAAWLLATSPDAGRPRLEKALAAIESLRAENPALPVEALDTQATLHYRLGSLAEAVFLERKTLTHKDSLFRASQLARFEWEYGNFEGGPFRPGAPLPVLTVLPGGALEVDLRGNRLPDRTLLRFVLGNADGAFASVSMVLGIEDTGNVLRSAPGKLSGAPKDLRAVLVFANVRGDGRGRTRKTRWTVQEVVPEVKALP